jgi:putative ABC transport system permease protein
LFKDILHAFRVWGRKPGITFLGVLSLGLGIGASTAVFSVVNTVLLRPLPYKSSDRLVALWEENSERGWYKNKVSAANFIDWKEQAKSFTGMAAYRETPLDVIFLGSGEPERLTAGLVSADYFRVLGIDPVLGRTFLPREDWKGGGTVAVLSHAFWKRSFGSRPDVLGKILQLNGASAEIVGVAPQGFQNLTGEVDLWLTHAWDPMELRQAAWARRAHNVRAVARLRRGVSPVQAEAELKGIALHLQALYPETNKLMGAGVTPLREWVVGDIGRTLILLLGAVGFVLLIACSNVANLMLARASSRIQEAAVRHAFGADRGRLIRQSMVESLVLALLGGALGLLLGFWGLKSLASLGVRAIPRFTEIDFDPHVFLFALLLAALTSVLFGLAPAFRISLAASLSRALKEGGAGRSAGTSNTRARNLLVVAELALTVLLVISAGLLVKSFVGMLHIDPGFKTENLLSAKISLPATTYSGSLRIGNFYKELLPRLSAIPGASAAAAVSSLPLTTEHFTGDIAFEGRPRESYGTSIRNLAITPDYFKVMGVPILAGRAFTDGDDEKATRCVIVNQALVRRYFAGQQPVTRRITFDRYPTADAAWWTIVGVVPDQKQENLTSEAVPEVYRPQSQWPREPMSLLVRSAAPPTSVVDALRAQVKAVDPQLPIFNIRPMEQVLADSVARDTFVTLVLALFAAVALIQASVGLYAVVAYSVSLRDHEIGIRMALGARAREVLLMVVRQGMAYVLCGLVLGLGAALGVTRSMASFLFRVKPFDPATFGLVSAVLLAVGFLACYLPARRAARVDPMRILRGADR